MELLTIMGSIASIVSLAVSLFVAHKVTKIGNTVRVQGDRNTTAGRDVKR